MTPSARAPVEVAVVEATLTIGTTTLMESCEEEFIMLADRGLKGRSEEKRDQVFETS